MPQIIWHTLVLLAGEPHQLLVGRRPPAMKVATPWELAVGARQPTSVHGVCLGPQLVDVFLQGLEVHLGHNDGPEAPVARIILKVLVVVDRGDENALAREDRLVVAVLLDVLVGVLGEELLDPFTLGPAHGPELLELHNPLALEQHRRLFARQVDVAVEMPLAVHAQDAGCA